MFNGKFRRKKMYFEHEIWLSILIFHGGVPWEILAKHKNKVYFKKYV